MNEVTGLLKVIMAVVDYTLSLTLLGRQQCAAAYILISCGRAEGERMVEQDGMAWTLGEKSHPMPWHLAVFQVVGGDRMD